LGKLVGGFIQRVISLFGYQKNQTGWFETQYPKSEK
jgi:hypothetical protein